jgi:hypothetical protein
MGRLLSARAKEGADERSDEAAASSSYGFIVASKAVSSASQGRTGVPALVRPHSL